MYILNYSAVLQCCITTVFYLLLFIGSGIIFILQDYINGIILTLLLF